MGITPYGWFIVEHPIKMDDYSGYPPLKPSSFGQKSPLGMKHLKPNEQGINTQDFYDFLGELVVYTPDIPTKLIVIFMF